MNTPQLIESQKKSFATYAIMALNNAQTVLDHIQKIVGIETPQYFDKCGNPIDVSEENLWMHAVLHYLEESYKTDGIASGDILPEKIQAIKDKLCAYFPFLQVMADNQRKYRGKETIDAEDLNYILSNIFRVIKAYRDTTAHYKPSKEMFNDNGAFLIHESVLAQIVNNYYTIALRKLAERYGYTTKDLAFIQNYRIDRKMRRPNLNFFLSLMAKNDDTNGKLHLSGVGVALLICLLLDKQYINIFMTKLPIFSKYGPQSEERRIIMRSMGICSVKIPKDKIRSEKDELSIAMDMLGELKKCPDELFDKLSPYNQARFRLVSSDHNEVLMKRSCDRFTQLLLQYIDHGKLFRNIRFHVNMGKLRYLFNPDKNCIDGITRVRVIEHPLNGYGRIDEMEERRKTDNGTFANTEITIRDFDNVQRDDADPTKYPYIVDTYTHYMLDNNKVEMSFCDDRIMPQIEEENRKWYVCKDEPACRMSTLELPAMAFHILLLGSERTEARIKEVYDKYRTLFDAMSKGEVTKDNLADFGIDNADLPQKVIDSITKGSTQAKDVKEHIKKLVAEMLDDTERRIERLREDRKAVMSKDNKMGKRGFRSISTGRLADFLAKDIVRMQPTNGDGTDKMTGLNYRIMQSGIATYNSCGSIEAKNNFKEMFNKAHLLGTNPKRNHPFLHKVFARRIPEDAIEFYAAYLAERKAYLNRLTVEMKIKKVEVPFVNKDNNKWKPLKQEILGEIYDELAIELPRHLFDNDIKACLKAMPQMNGIDFDNANTTYLIAEYMKRVQNDDSQEFYSMKRNYHYIDMLRCETDNRGSLLKEYTTTEEREMLWKERAASTAKYTKWAIGKKQQTRGRGRRPSDGELEEAVQHSLASARTGYQKCEKTIRRYKVQDALLFMLAKQTLTKTADFDGEEFKLKEIMPDSDKGILSKDMAMTFKFYIKDKMYTITADKMKLKNFGDFFALASDKRFIKLMEFTGIDTVSKDKLTEEFKTYDNCRPDMVTLVLKLEEKACKESPVLKEKIANGERYGFKDVIDELCKNGDFDEQLGDILRKIRNAFSHNSYPKTGIIEIKTLPEVALSLKKIFEEHTVAK